MNDLPVGRSVDETLRLVQAFQFTDKHGEGEGMHFILHVCWPKRIINSFTLPNIFWHLMQQARQGVAFFYLGFPKEKSGLILKW